MSEETILMAGPTAQESSQPEEACPYQDLSKAMDNAELEKKGVWIKGRWGRALIARAGGANKNFNRILAAKSRPHRRQIQTDNADDDQMLDLLKQVYADTVVLDLEVYENRQQVPFTQENVLRILRANPLDIWDDISYYANRAITFDRETLEADAKNSERS